MYHIVSTRGVGRGEPDNSSEDIGFRCAAAAEPVEEPEPYSGFMALPIDVDGNGLDQLYSFFDHHYPVGRGNEPYENPEIVMIYTGEERVDPENCTGGVNCYTGHRGVDYSWHLPKIWVDGKQETEVLAVADGTARLLPYDYYGGYAVEITHDTYFGKYLTVYRHLREYGRVAGEVSKGDVIGYIGDTGYKMPYHLHFEVRYDKNENDIFEYPGELVDPYGFPNIFKEDPWTVDPYNGPTSVWLWEFSPPSSAFVYTDVVQWFNNIRDVKLKIDAGTFEDIAVISLMIAPQPVYLENNSNGDSLRETNHIAVSSNHNFQITAATSVLGEEITSFLVPAELIIDYEDADVIYVDEETIDLYRWDVTNQIWIPSDGILDTTTNQIVTQTDQTGVFSLRGQAISPAPTITSVTPNIVCNTSESTIEITGTGFFDTTELYLGMGSLNVQYISPTSLTATLPSNYLPGVYSLYLENPDGQTARLENAITITGSIYLPMIVRSIQ